MNEQINGVKHKKTNVKSNKEGLVVLEVVYVMENGQEVPKDKITMTPVNAIGSIRTLLEYFIKNRPETYIEWHYRAIPRHPCFYCGRRGDTGDSFFSEDWDTPVHFGCVFEQIVKNPEGTEAWGMLGDFLIICLDNIEQKGKK